MFIAAWSCSLVLALSRPAFDIEVAPVKPIRPDVALVLEVTMTYRGERQIRIDRLANMNACLYELPESWQAKPKRYEMFFLMVGPGSYSLKQGESAPHKIRVSHNYDLTMPPGDHEIRVRARLADSSLPGQETILESAWVTVPVRILAPNPK